MHGNMLKKRLEGTVEGAHRSVQLPLNKISQHKESESKRERRSLKLKAKMLDSCFTAATGNDCGPWRLNLRRVSTGKPAFICRWLAAPTKPCAARRAFKAGANTFEEEGGMVGSIGGGGVIVGG